MSSETSQAGENLDFAAQLMLEALAKSSAELEITVNVLGGQLSMFSQTIDKQFRKEVKAAQERIERSLKQSVGTLSHDKDELIKQLGEFKQAEIQSLLKAGKELRSKLLEQTETTVSTMEQTMASKIAEIKSLVSSHETSIHDKFGDLQQVFDKASREFVELLEKNRLEGEQRFELTINDFEKGLNASIEKSLSKLESSLKESNKTRQEKADAIVSELGQNNEQLTGNLKKAQSEALISLEKDGNACTEKLKAVADSGTKFFRDYSSSFQTSLDTLSDLLIKHYESSLKNVSVRSRTEISGIAQKAEDVIAGSKMELQIALKKYQTEYAESFEQLLGKLEKAIDEEFKHGANRHSIHEFKEEKSREHLKSLFRKLGYEMIDGASAAASQLESEFEKSVEEFELRIDNAKSVACEALERESKLMQKELSRSYVDFEKQIGDLSLQISRIEKAGKDAANIVMTLKKADLKF